MNDQFPSGHRIEKLCTRCSGASETCAECGGKGFTYVDFLEVLKKIQVPQEYYRDRPLTFKLFLHKDASIVEEK